MEFEDTNSQGQSQEQTHYRPGYLYFSFFVWISATGGRYLAPFLENEGNLSSEAIGLTLALQSIVSMVLSSVGGSWADSRERHRPGKGRVEVMAVGISMGGLCCLLHSVQHFSPLNFFTSHVWHGGLQLIYAAFSVLTISVLDGTTIQFLEDHPDFTKEDYGKERFWGAIAWALVHMIISVFLDFVGFISIYPIALVSTLMALFTLYQYAYMNGSISGAVLKRHGSDVASTKESASPPTTPRLPLHVICRLLVGSLYGCTFIIAMLALAQGQAGASISRIFVYLSFLFFHFLAYLSPQFTFRFSR